MVSFAPDEIGLADQTPCAGIRADLKICLLNSDCCKKVGFFGNMFFHLLKYKVKSRYRNIIFIRSSRDHEFDKL